MVAPVLWFRSVKDYLAPSLACSPFAHVLAYVETLFTHIVKKIDYIMEKSTILAKNPEFRMEMLDGEALLYSCQHTKVVSLNHTAYVIWEMCDGQKSLKNITKLLCEAYPDSSQNIPQDVDQALSLLLEHQALISV